MIKGKSHRSCRRDFIRQAGRVAGVVVVLGALPAAATTTESQTHRADSIPVRLLGKTGVKLPILAYGGAALPRVWGNPLSHEDRVKLKIEENSGRVHEVLKRNGVPTGYRVLKGKKHYDVYSGSTLDEVMKLEIAWFDQHLKTIPGGDH